MRFWPTFAGRDAMTALEKLDALLAQLDATREVETR